MGIVGEEVAQMMVCDLAMVIGQLLPGPGLLDATHDSIFACGERRVSSGSDNRVM